MRLHRHDEIVEAISDALMTLYTGSNYKRATVALDAMLEAAVKLGVGKVYGGVNVSVDPNGPKHGAALILRMEARDDE